MNSDNNNNIAVYIDADNANSKDFLMVYNEIKKYGNVITGRIYGDWTRDDIKNWREVSIEYSFQTMNCFNLTKKNSTDIYLICDLMDDLHKNNNIDIFIIVSSDSDFTEPARRIRTNGKKVFGIGRKDTPKMLKNSCDKFIVNENLKETSFKKLDYKFHYVNENIKKKNILSKVFEENKVLSLKEFSNNFVNFENVELIGLIKIVDNNVYYIKDIFDTIQDLFENSDTNILNIGYIKEILMRKDSTFDLRNYGFSSMKKFLSKIFIDEFEITNDNNNISIRQKRC